MRRRKKSWQKTADSEPAKAPAEPVKGKTDGSGGKESDRGRGRRTPSDRFGAKETESFGVWLRRQREVRKIELPEIAERTKISLRYLKAMEQDRFELLPGPIFAKGFLREYAKFVGLSPDEVVNYYLSTQDPEATAGETTEAELGPLLQSPRWQRGLLLSILGLVVIAILSFLLFSYFASRKEEGEPAATLGPSSMPVEAQARPVAPSTALAASSPGEGTSAGEEVAPAEPLAPIRVTIDFIQKCWIEAVIDNDRRISELKVEGESLQISAEESIYFSKLGNAGGISMQVNGVPFDLGASLGEVRSDIRIDAETVRSLGQGAS